MTNEELSPVLAQAAQDDIKLNQATQPEDENPLDLMGDEDLPPFETGDED